MNIPPSPIASVRASRLRQGINLSHWFSQVYWEPGYTRGHFDVQMRPADFALIRDMGFDHVRFALACEPLLERATAGILPADYLELVHTRIRDLLNHDLTVIVDVHPEDPFKRDLAARPAAFTTLADFWTQLATALADLDPERVFFEILNEPCINDADRWNDMQNSLAASIRTVAPDHTLILSGDRCSPVRELLKLTPPDDRNIIANFHLYDPIAFTHQGASWSPPWAMLTKGLTYPANRDFVTAFMRDITDPDALRQLNEYIEIGWSPTAYDAFVQPAVQWARRHGLCLTCNEFGTYRDFSPRASRVAWIRDVSTVLRHNGIGWTMWDYAGSFAVTIGESGSRQPDHDIVEALGLTSAPVGLGTCSAAR